MAEEKKIVYLNLQEQVGKNKKDIEELRTVKFNLERAGVHVVGTETSAEDLPDPSTYAGEIGDAYLIGTEPPYTMYVYTQPSLGEVDFKWFDLGAFPAVGPQGAEGPEGPQGPQGESSIMTAGTVNPTITGEEKDHDLFLNTTTGMVFEFGSGRWVAVGSIKGPTGPRGAQGPRGVEGPQGVPGPQGQQGNTGVAIEVVAVVETVGSLPDPDTVPRNSGYIVDDGVNKDLYIIVEESDVLAWYNMGAFTGVPGQAAGFGAITADAEAISPDAEPTASVEATGTDDALNLSFHFGIPTGVNLENTDDQETPSDTKGYTQSIITKRTVKRVITNENLTEITGLSSRNYMSQLISAALDPDIKSCLMLIRTIGNASIIDVPTGKDGLLVIETEYPYFEARFISSDYDTFEFAGLAGTPTPTAVWRRFLTTQDAQDLGFPAGGSTGQVLGKRSNDDFDTEWIWIRGIPNGGTTGQVLSKTSSNDGEASWRDVHEVPAGGTLGQVLSKASDNDYQTVWSDPPEGGGSLPEGGKEGYILVQNDQGEYVPRQQFVTMPENLLINPCFEINQRGLSGTQSGAKYVKDRWYVPSGSSFTYGTSGYNANTIPVGSELHQYIEFPDNKATCRYFLIGVTSYIQEGINSTFAGASLDYYGSSGYANLPSSQYGTIEYKKASSDTITYKQRWSIVDMFNYKTQNGLLRFKIINNHPDDPAYVINAFCYPLQNANAQALADLLGNDWKNPIPVVKPNYAVELEKCKYYFEKVVCNTPLVSSVTAIFSATLSATFYLKSYGHKFRIAPTLTFLNNDSTVYFYNGPTASSYNFTASLTSGGETIQISAVGITAIPCTLTNKTILADAEIYPA